MPALGAQTCANHPGRPGFALCMACRKVVCQECATTWDGVNHCRACLAAKGTGTRTKQRLGSWLLLVSSAALLFLAAGRLLAWSAALAARAF